MNKEYQKRLEKICELVDERRLPESAIPRLFYVGHNCIATFHIDEGKFKCIDCGRETTSTDDLLSCACGSKEIFEITDNRKAEWECIECKHQWISEDGTKCPSCGSVRES